jgi:hypothetical protein
LQFEHRLSSGLAGRVLLVLLSLLRRQLLLGYRLAEKGMPSGAKSCLNAANWLIFSNFRLDEIIAAGIWTGYNALLAATTAESVHRRMCSPSCLSNLLSLN